MTIERPHFSASSDTTGEVFHLSSCASGFLLTSENDRAIGRLSTKSKRRIALSWVSGLAVSVFVASTKSIEP